MTTSQPPEVLDYAAARHRPRRQVPRIIWPILALAIILLFNAAFTKGFFSVEMKEGRFYGSLIDIPDRAAPVMLLSLGMTLVLATGGVDLSVGAIMAISGALATVLLVQPELLLPSGAIQYLAAHPDLRFPVAIFGALVASILAGVWNGALVAWVDLQPIVATLILMVAGRGIAQLMGQGQIITVDHPSFSYIGSGFLFRLPFTLTIVAVMTILTIVATRLTALGLFIESVGNNALASRYAGVDARLVRLMVYVFSGFCAGVAGLIAASDIRAADANNAGLYMELDAILAVVIGGTSLNGGRFYLIGALIGAVVIQAMTTTILMTRIAGHSIPPAATLVVKAIVVLVVCLLQSDVLRQKLFTRRRARS